MAATSSLRLGEAEQARTFASQALEVYEQAPSLSPARRAITALDLGIACARLDDVEQAIAHGLDALATPRPAAAIATRSASLQMTMQRSYPGASVMASFCDSVAALPM
ncbi:tetratricopeptide repeat protein [Nonomuraea turkmeniaca]|uniref:Tetratricopeptide repeat protein n=1 Tax=Nonomuraea turkmeniaca TaxID=103838 RepID=A0A5S4F3P9_9ACTN|nr:tetratricopeptide repeat protein [Nonomuraea turkmeniaca]TMR10471.1 tetratricopeptide repeat protein [Nonomuraea turkmeniaca]